MPINEKHSWERVESAFEKLARAEREFLQGGTEPDRRRVERARANCVRQVERWWREFAAVPHGPSGPE
jgi:hypothetical protein